MYTSITGLFVVAKSLDRYFFRFKLTILLLTFKERGIYAYLQACLLWHHPWIDIFFRFKCLMRCILQTVNCIYDPYKPYGSTNRCDPFVQMTRDIYSRLPNEMRFPIIYGPKTAFAIPTNCMDRQTVVTPPLSWIIHVSINVPLMRYNFPIAYGPKTSFTIRQMVRIVNL